jgi:hypothetical protein
MEGALGTRRCALNTNMQPRQQKADTTKQHRSRLKWALVYTLQEIGFYSRCLKNNWKNSFPQYFHDNVLCIEISGNSHCFGCKDLYSIAKHTTSSMIFHVHPPPKILLNSQYTFELRDLSSGLSAPFYPLFNSRAELSSYWEKIGDIYLLHVFLFLIDCLVY